MPSLPHAPIPAKSDKTIAHVNNFRHHKKDQRRSAPTLFTSSECFIHIIGIRSSITNGAFARHLHEGRGYVLNFLDSKHTSTNPKFLQNPRCSSKWRASCPRFKLNR